MKAPPVVELRKFNSVLKKTADVKYRRLLRSVVMQWAHLGGDFQRLADAVCSWDVPRLIEISDSLVSQKYDTATMHFVANQIAALVRKYPYSRDESKLDPERTAVDSFKLAERRCRRINMWFASWNKRSQKTRPLTGTFERASRWIRYVISDTPDLPEVYSKCDITSGANIGVHGDATNLARKLLAPYWSVNVVARPYFAAALSANFHFSARPAQRSLAGVQSFQVLENDLASCCKVTNYNKVGFVPKTAKTHRAIAVEPLGNTYLQKGCDQALRDRLRRVGLDLSKQGPNQQMAREGSFDDENSFVTIDLSSASDSISIGLCRALLPPDWFYFLNSLRSPSYMLPGSNEPVRYEKFVSMGNGFCFPLQTLLFASLIKGVDSNARPGVDFRVYGDDIIVRKNISCAVISLLERVGFKTNSRKTFVDGPFRESCGSNWYLGEDVTPMTLDWKLDSLENLFKFLNLSRRNVRTSTFFSEVLPDVIGWIPDKFLFYRPYKGRPETGIDPVGLEFRPRWGRHSAWQCPSWLELHVLPVEDRLTEGPNTSWVVMAAALRGSSSSKPFTFRRRVEARIRRVASGCPEQPDIAGGSGWIPTNDGFSIACNAEKPPFLNARRPQFSSPPSRVE